MRRGLRVRVIRASVGAVRRCRANKVRVEVGVGVRVGVRVRVRVRVGRCDVAAHRRLGRGVGEGPDRHHCGGDHVE